MDYIGVKRFDDEGQRGRRTAHRRPLHLHRLYRAPSSQIPYLRSQGGDGDRAIPASIRASHSGKALLNTLESYPRDDLFQIDVPILRKLCRARSSTSPSGRACGCCRASTISTASSPSSSSCRATTTTFAVRERSATYLKTVYDGRVSAYYPAFPEGGAGARALHHRPLRRQDARSRPADARSRRSARSRAPGPMRFRAAPRRRATTALAASPRVCRGLPRRPSRPTRRWPMSRRIAGLLARTTPITIDFYRHADRTSRSS